MEGKITLNELRSYLDMMERKGIPPDEPLDFVIKGSTKVTLVYPLENVDLVGRFYFSKGIFRRFSCTTLSKKIEFDELVRLVGGPERFKEILLDAPTPKNPKYKHLFDELHSQRNQTVVLTESE